MYAVNFIQNSWLVLHQPLDMQIELLSPTQISYTMCYHKVTWNSHYTRDVKHICALCITLCSLVGLLLLISHIYLEYLLLSSLDVNIFCSVMFPDLVCRFWIVFHISTWSGISQIFWAHQHDHSVPCSNHFAPSLSAMI